MENSEIQANSIPLTPHAAAKPPTHKRKGEVAELAFMLKAISLGFGVAKPWGDSDRYDFVLVSGQLLWRVQVKSAWVGPGYLVKNSGAGHSPYTPNEIDFLVAYIVPKDLWYVVPVSAIVRRTGLWFHPSGSGKGRLEKYNDAWSQFREAPPANLGKAGSSATHQGPQ